MTKETTVKFSQGEIEKRIWGHRLYNEQTGMMTLLEFLCVLERHPFHEQLANPNISDIKLKHKQLAPYSVAKRPLLRSLIFNNPYIDEIYDNNIADP